MSYAIEGLIYCYRKNLDYGPKLVSDLTADQMVAQPVSGLAIPANHPAWIFSHLNVYLPIIEAMIQGQTFADPKDHPFAMQRRPQNDSALYASREEWVDTLVEGHQNVIRLLSAADDSLLGQPVSLARWQPIMPNLGIALPYLMLNHENSHLGQLSTWRRVQGLPPV
jgi:hypothetical protein